MTQPLIHRATNRIAPRLALLAKRYVVAVAGLGYGLTLGLRRNHNRALVAKVARHFGYRGISTGRLRRTGIDELTKPSTAVILPIAAGRPGNVSELELIVMSRMVVERQPARLLEIGTFDGRTTAALSANAPATAQVSTLDLPPDADSLLPIESRDRGFIDKPRSGAAFDGSPYQSKIRQLFGDSARFDFGDLRIDFAFIDGSHSYEYVMSDSRRVRGMLRDGKGVIVWHDYGDEWEGVTRALDELSAESDFAELRAVEGTTLAVLELK